MKNSVECPQVRSSNRYAFRVGVGVGVMVGVFVGGIGVGEGVEVGEDVGWIVLVKEGVMVNVAEG